MADAAVMRCSASFGKESTTTKARCVYLWASFSELISAWFLGLDTVSMARDMGRGTPVNGTIDIMACGRAKDR